MTEKTRKIIRIISSCLVGLGAAGLLVALGAGGQSAALSIVEAVFIAGGVILEVIRKVKQGSNMADIISGVFSKEFSKILDLEQKDPDFLNQKNFSTCLDRANAAIDSAGTKPAAMLAYSIADHREKKHGEDHTAEKLELKKVLSDKEVRQAVRGFWRA